MSNGAADDVFNTTSGPICGTLFEIDENRTVRGFLGIPYAQPPVGQLRFKTPEPVKLWTEIRECTIFGPRCPQNDDEEDPANPPKDEANCLSLNVFAPNWKSENFAGFPIMVWIHGGCFTTHSSANYGSDNIAQNLCAKGVIVVTVNYRLGIFGFLRTGDECKGNFGLWDQTLALRWVEENASIFGGDPNNITLIGQSAGGASVDLLSLSPHSRDLFQRVIMMSGCAGNVFASKEAIDQEEISAEFARLIGWDGATPKAGLLEFYCSKTTEELELGVSGKPLSSSQNEFGYPIDFHFTPNIDGDFFPKSLAELRKEAPVKDVITGVTECEGLYLAGLSPVPRSMEGLRELVSRHIPSEWPNYKRIREKVFQFYLKGKDDQAAVEHAMAELIGDRLNNLGLFDAALARHKKGEHIYMYRLDFVNPESFGPVKPLMPFLSSTHSTDLVYLFGKAIFSLFDLNEQDLAVVDVLTTYFTNFAKRGNPNGNGLPEWKPLGDDFQLDVLSINTIPKMKHATELEERWRFWEELLAQNQHSSS